MHHKIRSAYMIHTKVSLWFGERLFCVAGSVLVIINVTSRTPKHFCIVSDNGNVCPAIRFNEDGWFVFSS
jgi:hypothetical protein